MQITNMTEEIYSALHELWEKNAARLPDELRDPDLLDYFLFQDGGSTRLYTVGHKPAVVIVGEIKEGLSATVLLLNHEFAEVGEILHELRQIIDELALKRLTAQVPGPVKDVQRQLEKVGFRREGHLRRSTIWNGRLCGTDVYGFYKDPTYEGRRSNGNRPSVRESRPAAPAAAGSAEYESLRGKTDPRRRTEQKEPVAALPVA